MNCLDQLERLGVEVSLQGENIALDGPESLSDDSWEQALRMAKQRKHELISALRKGRSPSGPAHDRWINDHSEQLLKLGWTQAALRKLPNSRWWEIAVDAFVDEGDATVNILTEDEVLRCVHPDGLGW